MEHNNNNSNGVAWTALIIAVIALILAWTAFNRSGADLEQVIERQVFEAINETAQEYQEAEREVRQNTAAGLNDVAAGVSVDGDVNNVGE